MAEGRYTRIKSIFWNDEKTKLWDDDTRYLALYILTSPHNNILGCHVLPKLYICADLGWNMERLDKAFLKLLDDGFIQYDDTNNLIFIANYLKHNPIENGNQAKGAEKQLAELPKSPLLQDLKQSLKQFEKPFLKPLIERIPEPNGKPVTVTVTATATVTTPPISPPGENASAEFDKQLEAVAGLFKQENKTDEVTEPPVESSSAYPADFEAFWHEYPRKKEKQAAFKCWKARKKEGHLPRDMLLAASRYAAECARRGTEEQYIKLAKSFLGPAKPFTEYLTEAGKVVNLHARDDPKPYRG